MLGVTTQPTDTPSDRVMAKVADRFGKGDTYGPTRVGVFFGRGDRMEPGVEVPDPFFGGVGPARKGCLECGACMTGCRHGAKNTMNTNYLYLAEKAGAAVHPETTVVNVTPRQPGGFTVDHLRPTRKRRATGATFTADQVVFSAGTWGTQTLLHRLRDTGRLPRHLDRLGELTRTNSEAIVGAVARRSPKRGSDQDFTAGRRDHSSWFIPTSTPTSSRSATARAATRWACCGTVLVDGDGRIPRPLRALGVIAPAPASTSHEACPSATGPSARSSRWSCSRCDNSITVSRTRRGRLTSRQGPARPTPPTFPSPTTSPERSPRRSTATRWAPPARSSTCR